MCRALLLRLHKLKPELEGRRAQEEQDLRAKLEAEMEAAWQQIDFMRKRLEVRLSFSCRLPAHRTVLENHFSREPLFGSSTLLTRRVENYEYFCVLL